MISRRAFHRGSIMAAAAVALSGPVLRGTSASPLLVVADRGLATGAIALPQGARYVADDGDYLALMELAGAHLLMAGHALRAITRPATHLLLLQAVAQAGAAVTADRTFESMQGDLMLLGARK